MDSVIQSYEEDPGILMRGSKNLGLVIPDPLCHSYERPVKKEAVETWHTTHSRFKKI